MGLLLTDNNFLPQAKTLVEQAKSSIDIVTFKAELTHKPRGTFLFAFFNELILQAKKGLRVRILLNWNSERRSVPLTNKYVMEQMKTNNVQVRHLPDNRCCHAKLILVDKQKAIIGSHNLSVKSCHNNFEMSYLIPDPETVKEISDVFARSWGNSIKMK